MKACLWLVVALLLLVPEAEAVRRDSGFWWPGGTSIVVRDMTQRSAFGNMVKTRAKLWAKILPGGVTVTYVRDAYTNCKKLAGGNMLVRSIPDNEIWVCSQPSISRSYGDTWVDPEKGGPMRAAYIRLGEGQAGSRRYRLGTVCHELGHAFGLTHNKSKHSCVNSLRSRKVPGRWDAESLKRSYREDAAVATQDGSDREARRKERKRSRGERHGRSARSA